MARPPLLHLLLLAAAAAVAVAAQPSPSPRLRVPRLAPRRGVFSGAAARPSPSPGFNAHLNLVSRCERRTRAATLDHFGWGRREGATFGQRYYVCAEHWGGAGAPIFFYAGNEADVTLYLNATGLMWETAPAFGAALVFAEHRFYGASKPRSPAWSDAHLRFLTAEQAMADYAELVAELRGGGIEGAADSPVIVFGGSYGGMLATWLRLKYPSSFDGAIAGSAPIWTFEGEEPPYDGGSFAATVTRDATPAAGAAPACADNVRAAFAALLASHRTRHDAQAAKTALRLCPSVRLRGAADAAAVADWVSGAFDSMAMGNYPYPSSYLLNGDATLPAWPMRAACGKLATPGLTGVAALTALGDAVSIYFNATGTVDCHGAAGTGSDATDDDGRLWGWQYCTEMFMPMWRDGVRDMFYAQPWDAAAAAAACEAAWGVAPRRGWADVEFGGRRIGAITNVVFSNGLYDPWSGGGVLADVNPTAVAVTIPEGGHHLDLMFAHEADPDSVKRARETQRAHIARWVAEKGERVAAGREGVATV